MCFPMFKEAKMIGWIDSYVGIIDNLNVLNVVYGTGQNERLGSHQIIKFSVLLHFIVNKKHGSLKVLSKL